VVPQLAVVLTCHKVRYEVDRSFPIPPNVASTLGINSEPHYVTVYSSLLAEYSAIYVSLLFPTIRHPNATNAMLTQFPYFLVNTTLHSLNFLIMSAL